MCESISAEAIRAGLKTRWLGREVAYYPVIGSTNDEARRLAVAGAPAGTLVIADEQTAGRGRLRRLWMAAPGSSLLFSLILRPSLAPAHAGQVTMLCGLAAADACHEIAGVQPSLKWPNDLLLRDRKVAGILSEMACEGERVEFLAVGIGINVRGQPAAPLAGAPGRREALTQDPSLADLADRATSLEVESGRPVSRLQLLLRFLELLEERYGRLMAGESPHQEWSQRMGILGRWATIVTAAGAVRGRVLGVDSDGGVVVETAEGEAQHILAGDLNLDMTTCQNPTTVL